MGISRPLHKQIVKAAAPNTRPPASLQVPYADIPQCEWSPYGPLDHAVSLAIQQEIAVTDLIYLALGVGVVLVFAGYAVLLRRA